MVVEPRAGRESVLHELGHERLGIGEGGDAVADVAGRHDPELLAQAAAAPPSSATATTAVMLAL